MRCEPAAWGLCFIPEAGGSVPLAALAGLGLEGGARVIQLRLKEAADREWLSAGRELLGVCRRFGRPLVVNDRPDMALRLGADGVHLGQEDVPVPEARRVLGDEAVIGVSVRGPQEARRARRDGANYLSVGPVFPTPVKGEVAPVGLEAVARVRRAVDLPLLGIGGISAANAADVIEAGADGVAVIAAISRAGDPRAAAAELLAVVEKALNQRRKRW